eukprot:m.250581 g.250581  ORF g.250581 m.250581 type:complete len:183 (+) comp40321_c3_seq58:975-1523(+)
MAFVWLFADFMSWMSASAILLVSVIAGLLYKVVRTWKHSKLVEKVFDGPSAHWLYGSLEHYGYTDAKLRRTGEEFTVKYPLAYHLWQGPFNINITTTHPDSVKSVLGSEPKSSLYSRVKSLTGVGLIVAEGGEWRRHRHLLNPAFHFNALKPYVEIYNERCRKTDILLSQNSMPIDVCEVAR